MAIVRSLKEGSVLYKFTNTQRRRVRDPNHPWRFLQNEDGTSQYRDVVYYHVVKLYSRRNRTNGCIVDDQMKPFLEKLKIKLIPHRTYKNGQYFYRYVAVGCDNVMVDEETYNSLEVDEVAEKYFKKIKNEELLSLMGQNEDPDFVIDTMKNLIEEETETEALELDEDEPVPPEPRFREYHNVDAMWT